MTTPSTDATVSLSSMALDHPGWITEASGRVRRAFRHGNTTWVAICESDQVAFEPTVQTSSPADTTVMTALIDWFDPSILPEFFHPTTAYGARVQRVRNPDLWDALLPPILRQRRAANHAERIYRQLCIDHGSIVPTTAGLTLLPPTAKTVANLPDEAFINLGIRDKRQSLRAAAEAALDRAPTWTNLPPSQLFTELQTIPHIGAWTAGAIVADTTNDHSHYSIPVDAAHRRWKEFLTLPSAAQSERDFSEAWATLDRPQRSTLVALLLAAPRRRPTADRLVGGTKRARRNAPIPLGERSSAPMLAAQLP